MTPFLGRKAVNTMNESVLDTIRRMLGIPDDGSYDNDIIVNINAAFFTLYQLGVGTLEPFVVKSDQDVWSSFTKDSNKLEAIKLYIYIRTRLAFDPPLTSFVIDSLKKTADEIEWRLTAEHDGSVSL